MSKAKPRKKLSPEVNYQEIMSAEDKQVMNRLTAEMSAVDEEAVLYIQNGPMPQEKNNFDQMNKFVHMQMFAMCLQPIQQGISPSNLVQSLVMYKTMSLLNKDFRNNVHSTVSKAMLPHAEKMANKPGASAETIRKRDAILREANNGRLPLDEHSAALIRIGICRNAYNMSREPGANLDGVMEQYNQAMSSLEQCMQQDGVDMDATDAEMRTIVGRFAREDSHVMDMFAETSYRDVVMSGFHEETIHVLDENGHPVEQKEQVWRGEFETSDGEEFQGGFTPRFPQSREQYQSFITGRMYDNMSACMNGTDLFNTIASGPAMYDSDGRLPYWMQQDGFSEEDIVQMQKEAFESSLSDIQHEQPNLFKDFQRVYAERAQAAQRRSERGHEFDDRFGTEEAQSSAEYC